METLFETRSYLCVFGASFAFVFLRAFLQRLVAFGPFLIITPISILTAGVEVWIIANIANKGWELQIVLSMGVGAGLGATLAALFHKKYWSRSSTG